MKLEKFIRADEGKSKHAAFDNYNHMVFTTLSLTNNEIKKESPETFELLVFCSYLNSKSLSESLLGHYSANILKADTISFRNSLSILSKYSLISLDTSANVKNGDNIFTMQELTQLTVQNILSRKEKEEYVEKALSTIASFLPNKLDELVPYLSEQDYFLLNMEAVSNYATQLEIYNNDLIKLELRVLEYILPGKRDFLSSAKLIDKINQLMAKVSYPDPVLKVRFAVMNSAFQAWHNFDSTNSLKYALDALALLKDLSSNNEEKLMVYNRLLNQYQVIGDYNQALIYAKQGEELTRNDNTVGNQDALFGALAKIYLDKGDFDTALAYAEKAVDKVASQNSNMFAGDIPVYITKSLVLIRMVKYEEAFSLLSKVHEATAKIFGQNDHIHKAIVSCYYGYILFAYKSEILKAKSLLLQGQEIFNRVLGEKGERNRLVAIIHRFMGEIYEKEGDNIKAQSEYARALQILTNSYNGSKVTDDFSDLYTCLAIINIKLEDPTTAQYYLDLHQKDFGYNHQRTNKIIKNRLLYK